MQKYIDAAFSSRPVMPLSGAKVTVTTANGDLATLYSDNAGTLMDNPIYTDNAGNYSFYAADGRYTITISKTGFQTQIISDVLLEDPSDQVADLEALQLPDYAALRAYVGPRKSVYVAGTGIAGMFVRDDADTTTLDDGLMTIVTAGGVRFKRRIDATLMPRLNSSQKPYIIAHRGYSVAAPQNTLMAFGNAIDLHADALECDVQISSDGVFYVFHDTTVDALTNGTGTFTDLSSATIDGLIFDATVGTPFAGAKIPRLTDFLALARDAGIRIYPEVKTAMTDAQLASFVATLGSYGYNNQNCVIQANYIVYAKTLRSLSATVGITYVGAGNMASAQPFIDTMASLGGSIFWQMGDLLTDPSIVIYAYGKNVDVVAWTVTQANDIRKLRAIGVNRFVCDSPVGGYV